MVYIQWNTIQPQKDILPIVTTWMYLESIMLSEISQIEKDKHCMLSLYVEAKKQNKINK